MFKIGKDIFEIKRGDKAKKTFKFCKVGSDAEHLSDEIIETSEGLGKDGNFYAQRTIGKCMKCKKPIKCPDCGVDIVVYKNNLIHISEIDEQIAALQKAKQMHEAGDVEPKPAKPKPSF